MSDWKQVVVTSEMHKRLKILSAVTSRPISELVADAVEQAYFSASSDVDISSETLEQYIPASP